MQNMETASFQDPSAYNNGNKVTDLRISSQSADLPSPKKTKKNNIIKEILQCKNCRSSRKLCISHENSEKELIDHMASCFKSFNKSQVIQELSRVFEIHQAIHLKIPTKIRYLARKFELPRFLLPSIVRDLQDSAIDLRVRINLAQALKYGVRNNLDIDYEELIELLEGDSAEIKTEILWALGYKVKNSAEGLTNELIEKINTKVTQDMTPEARAFLKSQISQHDFLINEQVWQGNHDLTAILNQNLKRRPQTIVTKNQQVVKGQYQNLESQESKVEFSSIIGALKNQKSKRVISERVEKLPKEEKESKGSNCAFLKGIYDNSKVLYDRAQNGLVITDRDKDVYLTKEFLAGFKFGSPGILGDLLTDRTIAAIFKLISKKQKLAAGSLEKLIHCLDDPESFAERYYLKRYSGPILEKMLRSWFPINPNDFERNVTETMQLIHDFKDTNQLEMTKKAEYLFFAEIARIRRDAISAIYNCALRDRNILTKNYLEKIQQCLLDSDRFMRAFAVKILGTLIDSHDIHYRMVFQTCLRHLEESVEIQESLDYIHQQSKDAKRCEELFTDKTVFRLTVLLLKKSDYDFDFRIDCLEILNNYLDYSLTKGLNIEALENLCLILEDDQEKDKLKEKALILILLTAEKEKRLPDGAISSLTVNFEYFNDLQKNLIIIILGTICDEPHQTISYIEEISSKLLDDRVIVGQGSTITFEPPSSENSLSPAISMVAGKITLNFLKKGLQLSLKVTSNLLQALENTRNKQTRILVAKAISFAWDHGLMDFNRDLLKVLEDFLTDEISDVAIYITNAFTKIYIVLLSQEETLISSSHMELLASVYADQELRFDGEDFSVKINENILNIFADQASRQTFSESILSLFDYIFLSDDLQKGRALHVMGIYTENHNIIPESTVLAIESLLGKPDLTSVALNVLEKVIENEQIVSDRTLKFFADYLFLKNQEEDDRKNESLKVLETADNNQDLSDNIFEVLELERAGLAIDLKTHDFEAELSFLEIETQAGRRLSSNVFKALSKQVKNSQVLSILVNVSTNGQLLPGFLIHELNEIFVPKEKRKQLVQIFFNLAKNNQDIPKDLLEKLERMVAKHAFSDQTILIFTYQAQKGERLSHSIMKSICDKILTTENQSLKQECLSAICSILQTDGDVSQLPIEEVLVHCLSDDNEHIVLASLEGFSFICSKMNFSHNSIEALMKKVVQPTCPNDQKQKIILLLGSQTLTIDQANLLKLVTLNCEADFQLLTELSKKGNLLAQNFQQIDTIINESFTLQKAVIDMLVLYPKKDDIPEYLIDSIATLMFRTSSKELRGQCLLLIGEIAKSERILSKKAVSLVCALQDANEILKLIGKNQEIPKDANLLLQIEAMSVDSAKSQKLLKKVIAEMDCGLKLPETAIKKLVELAEKDDGNNLQEFAVIFSRALLQDPRDIEKRKIVDIIEKAIEAKKIDLSIIQAYGKIIKSQKCKKLLESLDILVEHLLKNPFEGKDSMISLEIFSCIANAAAFGDCSEKGLQLLEKNITNPDVKIRRKCFQGVMAAKGWGYSSEVFECYCHNFLLDLEIWTGTEMKFDYDLLETFTSVEFLDLAKLKEIPYNDWIRELLLSDLLARFKANEIETYHFYKEWLEIEEYLKSQYFDPNRILKTLHCTQGLTLENLNEILKFLPKIDFNRANHILLESLHPFQELKQQWLISLLTQCLNNQQVNKSYIDWLSSDIISKLTTPVIAKLFAAFSQANHKLTELMALINFAAENKIKTSDIYRKDTSISDLKRSLEIKLLSDRIQSPINRYKLATTLDDLFDHGWSFGQLIDMFKKIESKTQEESFLQVLESLVYYKIPITTNKKILEILDGKAEGWAKKVNEMAIDINFQANTQVKNHVELISELKSLNSENSSLQKFIEQNLAKYLLLIKHPLLNSRINFKITESISEWTKTKIYTWAKMIKSPAVTFNNSEFLVEALAVIKRANFLYTGFHLTDAQLLSCLVQLNGNPKQGRLLQVGTGEGKSTIVSVIAIIYALKGKKVDIITSSPVLAERDAREKAGLYKMFGLSCADNDDRSIYSHGPKSCYKQDIVYGEIAQFQFDTLRDKYSMLGTLAGRECEVAIIDEVDSMLIDDSMNIARLSSSIAGMDMLQPFIHLLWQRLNLLQQRLVAVGERNFFLSDQVNREAIENIENLNNLGIEIEEDVEVFLKRELESYLKEDLINEGRIKVPNNFKEFVKEQLSKWIDNALRAFMSQEDQQYIIQDGVVKPVAYDSTGIVQSATSWGDGLHQLIQRKHGLRMTSETCTTNFLSNIGYIKKYGSNLFGLTGTLGSKRAKEVLSGVYNVDLVQIPLLHKKQYLELPAVICQDHNEWLEEICDSAIYEANKERGTLIICQTIEHCKIVAHKLGQKYRAGAIKLYTMNNMNQEREIDKINSGEIIVATNLAGRGTDIKTDNIEKNGGLHVIVTFLPPNQRVEDQAFGRTARQGKRGTGQMILDQTMLLEYDNVSPQEIKKRRDHFESVMFDEFMKKELKMVTTKDKLFTELCKLLKKIRENLKAKKNFFQKLKNRGPSAYETNMLNALEERWALFLHKIENEIIPLSQSDKEYSLFEKEILEDFAKEKLIKNPYYHIRIANDLLTNSSFLESQEKQTLFHLEEAISLDPQQSAAAFVGKALLEIKKSKGDHKKKRQVTKEFTHALELISDEMACLNSLQSLLQHDYPKMDCDLFQQLIEKATILGSYMNSIQNALTVIKKSQRLIDVTGISHTKVISNFYDLERDEKTKKVEKDFGSHDKFTVVFNDLTELHEESGERDQAIETIQNAPESLQDLSSNKMRNLFSKAKSLFQGSSSNPISEIYKDFSIALNELNYEQVKELFAPDVQIFEVNKEIALLELKKKKSEDKVNLENVLDGKVDKSRTNLKAKDAIKIIKDSKNKEEKFNILFKDANKTAISLQKEILSSSTLIFEYVNLDCETAKNKLQRIKYESLHLEITGNKAEISKSLAGSNIKYVQLREVSGNNEIIEPVPFAKAIKRINMMKDNQVWIKIENLSTETAEKIFNTCLNGSFQLTFIDADPEVLLENLGEEELINISFTQITSVVAIQLARILRKASSSSLDFTLAFNNLTPEELQAVIKNASLDQEDLEITKIKKLSELFPDNARPNLELAEFAARGIEHLFEINEKRFIPWRSVMTVAAIGSVQIALGTLLITTGFGASSGLGLITEGAADYITAYRAYKRRHFTWSDYAKQKAVSLVISAVSVGGAGRLKDGFKGVISGIKREAIEQAGTQVVVNSQSLKTALSTTAKSLQKLSIRQVAVTTSEVVIREGLNNVTGSLVNFTLEKFKPDISSFIQKKVEMKFNEEKNLRILVSKMSALDKIRNSDSLSIQINKIAQNITSPERSRSRDAWDSIGMPLCQGIFSDVKLLGMNLRIMGTLSGITQIGFMIDKTHNQFVKKLSEIDKDSLSIHCLLHQHCKIPLEDAKEISKILKAKGVVKKNADCEYIHIEQEKNINLQKIDFQKQANYKETVVKFCEDFHQYTLISNMNGIMKLISDIITEKIIRVTESHLITPWSTLAVGELTNNLSANIQNSLIQDQLKNDAYLLSKTFKKKIRKAYKNENKLFTYTDLIHHQAKRHAVSYTQCENIYNAQQKQTIQKPPSQKVKNYAQQIKKSKPASLADMISLAARYGKNIKIVDDPDHVLTEEEKERGVQVILYTRDEKTDKGYYQLVDSNGKVRDVSSRNNDSGFDVFSAILKKEGNNVSVGELRTELGNRIIENSGNYSKIIEAQEWAKNRYPEEANRILFTGGLNEELDMGKKVSLAQRENHQMLQRKKWIRSFKNTAATVIKVTVKITETAEIIIKEKGAEANPRLSSIMTAAKIARMTAVGLNMATDLISSAFENDILSSKFLIDILHQIEKNELTINEAAACLKLKCLEGVSSRLKEFGVSSQKLRTIQDMIKIYQQIKNGKIDLLKAIFDIDKNQIFKKREWRRYFKDTFGIAKKILSKIMKALEVTLKARGDNPALSSLMNAVNSTRKGVINIGQIFEIINSACEHSILSAQFLENILNQIVKIDFSKLETPTYIKSSNIEKVFLRVKNLRMPSQNLVEIKKMMRIYKKVQNRRGDLLKALIECFSQELQDPKILAQIYQFFSKEVIVLENEVRIEKNEIKEL